MFFTASLFVLLINVLNAMEVGLPPRLLFMVHLVQQSLLKADLWDLTRFGLLGVVSLLHFLGDHP